MKLSLIILAAILAVTNTRQFKLQDTADCQRLEETIHKFIQECNNEVKSAWDIDIRQNGKSRNQDEMIKMCVFRKMGASNEDDSINFNGLQNFLVQQIPERMSYKGRCKGRCKCCCKCHCRGSFPIRAKEYIALKICVCRDASKRSADKQEIEKDVKCVSKAVAEICGFRIGDSTKQIFSSASRIKKLGNVIDLFGILGEGGGGGGKDIIDMVSNLLVSGSGRIMEAVEGILGGSGIIDMIGGLFGGGFSSSGIVNKIGGMLTNGARTIVDMVGGLLGGRKSGNISG